MALPAFLDPILEAPKWQKLLFGLFGLLAIGAAGYFLLLSPVEARVALLEQQQATLQRELAQNRAVLADLSRYRKMVADLETRLAELRQKLPTEKETPPLYRTLSDAASQSGLAVSLFQPREPRPRDYYSEIPITVRAEGGYHQIGRFFERMATLPRVVTVGDWKLSGHGTGAPAATATKSPVSAELTLATYTYTTAPPPAKPGTPPKPAPPK